MTLYKCKCGAMEFYGSGMVPAPCRGCSKCGTVPGSQLPAIPHEYTFKQSVDTDDGPAVRTRCRVCYEKKGAP